MPTLSELWRHNDSQWYDVVVTDAKELFVTQAPTVLPAARTKKIQNSFSVSPFFRNGFIQRSLTDLYTNSRTMAKKQ